MCQQISFYYNCRHILALDGLYVLCLLAKTLAPSVYDPRRKDVGDVRNLLAQGAAFFGGVALLRHFFIHAMNIFSDT